MAGFPGETFAAYYAAHGLFTDPAAYACPLDCLPADLPEITRAVRGLVIHYRSSELVGCTSPAQRFDEVRTRTVASMLARLLQLDPRPLTVARPPRDRLIGCCRDAATLLCAVLRHRGIPARVRVGFARYLTPDLAIDHWVAEYWNGARWLLVDAEQNGPVMGSAGALFDPGDVPRDQFLVAGRVWQACRAGSADPHHFGYDAETTGLGIVRTNLLHDLACLNKVELTPWDFWGLGLTPFEQLCEADLALLDDVALLTQGDNDTLLALRDIYARDERLRVPQTVTTYSLSDEKLSTVIG